LPAAVKPYLLLLMAVLAVVVGQADLVLVAMVQAVQTAGLD
jgi:hypothetical protein